MKTVLITGASRGIGAEAAVKFHNEGYNVVINYNKSKENAIELCKKLKNSVAIRADVSDEMQVKQLVEQAKNNFGEIDVVVNNAGISQDKLFTDITTAEWQNMLNTNVTSLYNVCKYVVPDMIRNKQGNIINISSIWGITGASCEVHYSTSKAAVIGFTKALAKELGPSGIRVNAVAPGVIMTDMCKGYDDETIGLLRDETPLNQMGKAKDIAGVIYFLTTDDAGFITGQVISPNGGIVI